jgi:hypothetical protein
VKGKPGQSPGPEHPPEQGSSGDDDQLSGGGDDSDRKEEESAWDGSEKVAPMGEISHATSDPSFQGFVSTRARIRREQAESRGTTPHRRPIPRDSYSPHARPTRWVLHRTTPETSEQDQALQQRIEALEDELAAKQAEKDRLVAELSRPSCGLSVKSQHVFQLRADAVHALSLTLFLHRTSFTQTDLMGFSLDFHANLLAEQEKELTEASGLSESIASLRQDVQVTNRSIEEVQADCANKQKKIEQIKHELRIAQANIESDRDAYASELRWRDEISTKLRELKQKIKTKQVELDEQTQDLALAQAKLNDLLIIKRSLEGDLEDFAQREKPEVRTLASEVDSYQQRVRKGQLKLQIAEEHLQRRREAFEQVQIGRAHV